MNELVVLEGAGYTFLNVLRALLPLLFLFLIFQFLFLKLPAGYVFNLLKGILLALIGLTLFLQGVKIGFMPVGSAMGEILGTIEHKWLMIPLGFFLGFLATFSEPAVRILSNQVEESSTGFIRKWVVLGTISLGVAVLVALGVVKILYGIPFLYIIIPGYVLALLLIWFCDRTFVSIAFDAGGVATGPMAVNLLLSIAVGITSAMEGRSPIVDGFGLIALIALAPILSVMLLGVIFRRKLKKMEVKKMSEESIALIVTIVRKGWGDRVIEASIKAGASGGTIIFGRGKGIHEQQKIMGICIEPEKEVVLTVIRRDKEDAVLGEIIKAAELDKPGTGIAFVIPVEKVAGMVHASTETQQTEQPAQG